MTATDKLTNAELESVIANSWATDEDIVSIARELLAHRCAPQACSSGVLRKALETIRDGYGPNHLSKFALTIASAALSSTSKEGDEK